MMHDNRKNVPSREGFLGYMLLLLTEKYRYNRVAFYEVDPCKRFAKPILLMGPGTEKKHDEIQKNLAGVSLESKLEADRLENIGLRTSPNLEKRFKDYRVPLDVPSRFRNSYLTGKSFFGEDEEGYLLTDVDKRIRKIFGTDNYTLITVKGRREEVIGWFYADYRFSGKDLFKIDKEEIRYIEVITSSKLQTIRAHEARLESEKLALLGRFAATLVHESRNSLTSVVGFARLLLKKVDEYSKKHDLQLSENKLLNDLKKYLPWIKTEAERLERAINQISDFSTQKLKANYAVVNVHHLLKEAVKSANGNGQKYIIKRNGREVKVWTDPDLFEKAATNLAKNAFEAISRDGNRGELTVSIATDDRYVYSNFSNPQYIPPDICKEVFYPFSSTKITESTGLGLPIALRLMSANNGDLSLMTDPRKGTTSTLTCPLYRGQDKESKTRMI